MAGMYSGQLNILIDNELRMFGDLISDPSVILETRGLRYNEEEDPDDPEEIERSLNLSFSYSKYDEIVNYDAYYTKVRLFQTFGFGTRGEKALMEFMEDKDITVINEMQLPMSSMKYTLIEYIDRKYSTKGSGIGLGYLTEDHLDFDPELGYIPRKE